MMDNSGYKWFLSVTLQSTFGAYLGTNLFINTSFYGKIEVYLKNIKYFFMIQKPSTLQFTFPLYCSQNIKTCMLLAISNSINVSLNSMSTKHVIFYNILQMEVMILELY